MRFVALPLLVLVAACGLTDTGGLSEEAAQIIARQFAGAAGNGVNTHQSALFQAVGVASPPINVSISSRTNCTAGGRMEVTGSLTGNIDNNGSGILLLQAHQTITDWACVGGYVMNGDPYLSLSGTFSFLNGQLSTGGSMNLTGGFKWGTGRAESCQIRLSVLINNNGTGRVQGEVCSYTINETF